MNEIDQLLAHRGFEESTKVEIEEQILEIKQLCKIAGIDVVESKIYQNLINQLRDVSHTINAIDIRIAEIEQEVIDSKVVKSLTSEDAVRILDHVL